MSAFAATLMIVFAQSGPVVVTAGQDCALARAELAAGEDAAALARLERCDSAGLRDPAVQINHAVALARTGDVDAARDAFQAAARNAERFELETVAGEWVDSRVLARRGLAMLDDGDFGSTRALAVR